ncbi:MAG: phytanoyl-CoA dioxygenase family protein [Planctomycetes bacterium]|nr:phytanoyl-CoA dioxygenase family protein [Planctomycetota bacterium]
MYTISPEQTQQFQQQGYCLAPDFFTAEDVAVMRHELQRLRDDGLVINKCTEADGKTQTNNLANLQICPLTPHSDVFRSLAFFSPVGDAIETLIKPPFVLQLDQIFVKPAGHGYGTNWHQDNAYFGSAQLEPHRGVGMWIAIDDTNIENGTMRLIPGSHKNLNEHRRDNNSDHFITCADSIDETQAVPIEVKAGGVAFFNFGIAHCTKNNSSNADRSGLALHFAEEEIISGGHGEEVKIRGAEASNGVNEYGEDLSHAWVGYREQLLQQT